jgi:hypothetical protein
VIGKTRAVVKARRIHRQEAGASEQEDGEGERAVEALQHRGHALEHGRAFEDGGHGGIISGGIIAP